MTLPPGSSDRTVCQLQTVVRTDDRYDPYKPDGEVYILRGEDDVAVIPIVDTFRQCLKSTVFVNGREVDEHVYSLCDSDEPHVHQLLLSQYTVDGVDTVAA